MFRINLNQIILNIKGEPIVNQVVNPKTKKTEDKKMCIRDYLLTILGTRFPVQENKEIFWTTGLGILFSDEENKEVEISDDKAKFLKRIIENNEMIVQGPMGERKVEIFFPYELSQLLSLFLTEEEKKEYQNGKPPQKT